MKKITIAIAALAFVAASIASQNSVTGAEPFSTKIANSVSILLNKRAQKGMSATVPVLLVFKAQAKFEDLGTLSREDKGRAVYNRLVDQANRTQAPVRAILESKQIYFKPFFVGNLISIPAASVELIRELSVRPEIAKIVGDPEIKNNLRPDEAKIQNSSLENKRSLTVRANLTVTGAPAVWEKYKTKGENMVVAGQDTGVQYDHPGLKNHYRGYDATTQTYNHDFAWHDAITAPLQSGGSTCGYDSKSPCDDDQHGTHTMGTVVGSDGAVNEIGMAPGAKWIACRNMDAGFGSPSSYIDCYQFFLAPTKIGGDPFKDGEPSMAPHVINNSWGCPAEEGCDKDEMIPVLQAIKAAGIFNVVSAGNDGPDCSTINVQPATITEGAFVVGSYNHRNGRVSNFSSRGPSLLTGLIGPDIMAPGEQIFSSVPGGLFQDRVNIFQPWSGTSMAGPHVAGAVALLWSAVPDLIGKIDETADLLKKTATALPVSESCGGVSGSALPNNTSGYGTLNVLKAVDTASSK